MPSSLALKRLPDFGTESSGVSNGVSNRADLYGVVNDRFFVGFPTRSVDDVHFIVRIFGMKRRRILSILSP